MLATEECDAVVGIVPSCCSIKGGEEVERGRIVGGEGGMSVD